MRRWDNKTLDNLTLDKTKNDSLLSSTLVLLQLISFAQVPDYLEATIYDKENAVIMVRPNLVDCLLKFPDYNL